MLDDRETLGAPDATALMGANETGDGCACTADGSGGDRWGLLFLGVMFGVGLRFRRRR